MKNILMLFVFAFALFSCGDDSKGYGITHRYTYKDSNENKLAPAAMLNYLTSYDLIFNVVGEDENERNGKAKLKFKERMPSFTQEQLQAKLKEVLGDSVTGSISVKYYLYISTGNINIDSSELYMAEAEVMTEAI